MGACRHGDRCSRIHNRPAISPTLLLSNMYQRPDMITPGFKEEDQAAAALQALQSWSYLGRPIIGEFSPATDFREATCRQYEEENCRRGGRLITGTEMGSFTGMEVGKEAVRGRREEACKGTVLGGDREALVVGEKEARRGGRGLSNGTYNVRRRKREEQKHNSDYNFCNVVGSAVCFSAFAESFGCANMVT
ncbi:hypothetical protein IGI04_018689 [Brassica rapa subsp. trilocularis]|uniref:C3H1-type domain-containing protein n=1 Tax=Brassica rapa subsp. trilocularis TaxID=1813537 RepID=A0ABQ7MER2_BRACM|nr:hypothetical protein IGI04_018689 [Brassica rapa subsp. trilocularis]